MAYRPKTAEQIFLRNVLIRIVECELLRRKVRCITNNPDAPEIWKMKLEKLDNRIDLLTSAYNNNGGGNA